MAAEYEIRALYDNETIVLYQAYGRAIAQPALAAQRFCPPFSFHRMTWIKPSFLWLMYRSNWGRKSGQEHVLAVRIKRSNWDQALGLGVLTSFEPKVFASPDQWRRQFEAAKVHVQWDTERSLRGGALPYYSIQVGLSRHIIREYVEDWIVGIEDYTDRVRKIQSLLRAGKASEAKRKLPAERVYTVEASVGSRLLIR